MSMPVNYTLEIPSIKKYTCIYKFYLTCTFKGYDCTCNMHNNAHVHKI